jgi:hypothetical protein
VPNHSKTLLRDSGVKLKTRVKAGGRFRNHNETVLREPR